MSDEYILDDVVETFSDENGGVGQSGDDVPLDAKGEPLLRDLRHEDSLRFRVLKNKKTMLDPGSGSKKPISGPDGNDGGSLVGSTFRIGRKAVTTVIALGLLAVIASEGYAIYDTSQSNSESYFAFDWTSGYDNESKVFSASSPLFVENPGVIPKEANIAVTISMSCEENEVISQSDHDYSLGEEVTLEFEADVPQPMADCIDEGNDLMIDITGTVGLMVFGFEAVETDIPAVSFECSKNTEEGGGEPTLQGCVAWPKL